MDGPTITVVQGGDLSLKLTLKDAAEAPITTYTGSATLSGRVWPGDDQETIVAPTFSWIDATAGTIRMDLSDAQTSLIPPGSYPIELSIVAGSQTVRRRIGILDVLPTAGAATALPSYGNYNDLTTYVEVIEGLLDSRRDLSGAATQRYRAWKWINRQVMARYRREALRQQRNWGDGRILAFESGSLIANSSIEAELSELQGYLDDGRLILDDATVEAASRYAAYLILDDQPAGGGDEDYKEMAREQLDRAVRALAGAAFAVDTSDPADSVADLVLR